MITASGETYDATFSYRASMARIVLSYKLVAAYSRFLKYLGNYLADKLD